MKFRVERDVLADAVSWAARGLPHRPPMPVLAGIMIDVEADGTLTLSAFDYEVSAKISVPADVEEPGTVLVLGKLLADISKNLPDRPVEIASEGTKVNVVCGSSRFVLLQMPPDQYPTLPVAPAPSGTIAGDVFTQAVSQVSIAADRSDAVPIFGGVRVEVAGDKLTLIATDRYRLAMRDLSWNPDNTDLETAMVIPAKTLSDTAKSLGSSGSVQIALSDGGGLIGFEAGQRQTTTRLLDGEYPKVAALFPHETPTEAVVETGDLIEAVKRVALVAERNTSVRLHFSEDQLAINAGVGEDAQASEAIPCTLTGEEIESAFNPQYLLDGLHALSAPYCRFSFTAGTKPAVLTGQQEIDGGADSSYRYLLMPMRFAGA